MQTDLVEGGGRGPRRVDRASGTPLWQQVHDDLVLRVSRREFEESFPGELTLVREYAVSRHTVREALRRLRAAGVVRGERGRTSRLMRPTEINQELGTLYSMFASVEATGQPQRSEVRVLEVTTDPEAAARLELPSDAPLLRLERLRHAGDRPLALDSVHLPAELARPLLDVDFTQTALYTELDRLCGVRLTGGEEHIRAVVPTTEQRRLLAMPRDVAVLAIERCGRVGRRPVECRRTFVRGDRFAMHAEFTAGSGYQLFGSRPTP